jgi:hypothetical protein
LKGEEGLESSIALLTEKAGVSKREKRGRKREKRDFLN